MAHPKLATAAQRSFVAATTAALVAGPLALAGLAQTGETIGTLEGLKLTCEEALETEDANVIEEFCTAEELETLSPLTKSVDEVVKPTKDAVTKAADDVAPKQEDGGDGGEAGPTSPTDAVIGDDDKPKSPTKTKVGGAGENVRGFDDEQPTTTSGTATQQEADRKAERDRAAAATGNRGYNADGPILPGMQSYSSLTLQPFAAPLVSVPPVYELPQVAQQLFGSTTDATAADPQVAGTATAASPYSATGFSATSADPTGWLAATATGLIMLVGAGHALNGGRKSSRSKA